MSNKIFIAILSLLTMAAQDAKAQILKRPQDIPTIAYCDLVRDPTSYNQKIVRVKVTYIVGFEGSIMYDLACGRKDTWVRFEPTSETATNQKVLKKFRRLADASPERTRGSGINYPVRRVEVVWVGRFQGIKPAQRVGERTYSSGFGHLNGFDYQFNVQRIEGVRAIPKNVPWE